MALQSPTRISVAMCTCNGAAFLGAQLTSIARQQRLPDELLVSDDASDDDTLGTLEAFRRTAPFPVRVELTETRRGTVSNFEHALAAARGDIVVLADQDDVWRIDKLARLEAVLEANPGAGLAFSDADVVDAQLRSLGRGLWDSVGMDNAHIRRIQRGSALEALLHRTRVTGATTAVRSDVLCIALPFPDLAACDVLHDGWLALVAACVSDIVPVSDRLIAYRQHDAQQIGARPAPDQTRLVAAPWNLEPQIRLADALASQLEKTLPVPLEAADGSRRQRSAYLLAERRRHLQARVNLRSSRRGRRIGPVVGEVTSGRYRRHSSGLRSGIKDIIS